jgi:DNA-binding transcriptional MerR regulator
METSKRPRTLLESADAARLLDVTPTAVRAMARQGRLPVAFQTPRGGRLFQADDVLALRAQRERGR